MIAEDHDQDREGRTDRGDDRSADPDAPEDGDGEGVGDAAKLAELLAGDAVEDEPLITPIEPGELDAAIRDAVDSLEVEDDRPPEVLDVEPRELRAAIEALLLVTTRPLSEKRLCDALPGLDRDRLRGLLEGLAARYRHEHRGWDLRRIAGGWQLLTRTELHPWVRQLDAKELPNRLSRSAMETLAVVAYKQPVTRGAIEDIRGVQCGPMLRQLMDLKLVQVSGRDEEALGRPLLYTTTDVFLERFGLGGIEDLPKRHEFG